MLSASLFSKSPKHFVFCFLVSAPILPAGFKAFEFLDKEGLQNLGTLVKGRVTGVVVAAVVEDFGHVGHKLRELVVMSLLQTGFHRGEVCEGPEKCVSYAYDIYSTRSDVTSRASTLICSHPLAP